ncbi:MAG: methyl-accepting chemotaxis protein, partial [Lachnospiraceae bacterium]|nr:methyl-accepting chemotaxis protein [Lachnospiraceae bacterium]
AMKLAVATAKDIHSSVEKVQEDTEKLANGELDVHVQIDSKDEFGEMAAHFNDAIDKLKLYIDTIKFGLTEVGAGNFAVKPPIEFHGDFVALKDAIIHITEALSSTMREINDGSEQVALGAEQLAENAQTLAEGATTQAAAIQELTATIENVTTAAEFSAKQADESCKNAESFAKLAEQSSQEMELLTQAMERITETSREIESIISEIEDIASQTNLLSLNASIEAARAGEAGRGFAVVADQIGKLATDSAQSAVNTNSLIAKSLQEINAGNEITARTVAALQEVIQGIRTLADSAQQSRELSAEQASTMEQIQLGIIQIADVVQSNSASAEETSATSEELSAQSQNLKAMVDQFILLEESSVTV